MGTPFQFGIIAQLANIPACITLCELLRLSKAIQDALADSDSFLAQIAEPSIDIEDSCPHYHQVMRQVLCVTFSKDMQVKNIKHNIQLYYTEYVSSTQIIHIQVDPGYALSIIPQKLM